MPEALEIVKSKLFFIMFDNSVALTASGLAIIGQFALKSRVRKYFAHHIRKSTANFQSFENKPNRRNRVNRVVPCENISSNRVSNAVPREEVYAIELRSL